MAGSPNLPTRTRVFIAGSRSALEPVRRSLVAEGSLVVAPEAAPEGAIWSEYLLHEIAGSDLFIALLDPPKDPPETFYELGLAEGMGKPTLLVASPRTRLPVDLSGRVVIRPGDDVAAAVLYAVRQWQAARHSTTPHVGVRRYDQGIGERAGRLLTELDRLESVRSDPQSVGAATSRAFAFEKLIRDAFADAADAVAVAGEVSADAGADFVRDGPDLGVWSDALVDSLGSPLLIEVKWSLPTLSGVRAIVERLQDYLRGTSARSALVVYASRPSVVVEQEVARVGPPVYVISARDLLEGLRSRPLAEVLRGLTHPGHEGVDV